MTSFLGALNPIAFDLGGIQVHWYGIIISLAVMIAVVLSVREGKRRNLDEDYFYEYLLLALPFALISARAYYVIFEWSYYAQHPSEIYRIWDGGIAIYGGLIGALIVLVIYCRCKKISPWLFLDVIAPTVILAQGIGRWGNFMNQEAHGESTTRKFLENLHLPNFIIEQMQIKGVYYQPTFLYESLWDIAGFILLIVLRQKKNLFKRGEVFFSYVIWYSFGRFFIEGMRTDSLMLGFLRVSQWLSAILFIGAIIFWYARRYFEPLEPWYLDGNDNH